MKISFIDKFGDTVFIDNKRDVEMAIEKYIGFNAVFPILKLIEQVEDELGDYWCW